MKLIITNPTEAPTSSFFIIGDSTARGKVESIGNFGSGAKHAILTLLRHNIPFKIYSGVKHIPITVVDEQHGDRIIPLVYVDNRPTSMALAFGATDWTDPAFALRELISNALDNGAMIHTALSLVTEVVPTEGITQIMIDANIGGPIFAAMSAMKETFLHYTNQENTPLIEKSEPSLMKLYRKGVLINTLGCVTTFDYNDINGDIKVDESRQFSNSNIIGSIATVLKQCNEKQLLQFATKLIAEATPDSSSLEYTLHRYHFQYTGPERTCFRTVGGELYDYKTDDTKVYNQAIKEGVRILYACHDFLSYCIGDDLPDYAVFMNAPSRTTKPAPINTTFDQLCKAIWAKLELLGHTNSRPMPEICYFTHTGTDVLFGFVAEDKVHLNTDQISKATVIEEFIHYCHGCNDETRAFQEVAIKIIASLI